MTNFRSLYDSSPACLYQILEIPGPFDTNQDSIHKLENGYIVDFSRGIFSYKSRKNCYIAKVPPGENTI